MSPTRAALEAALAADPDDPARHAAYADLLIEEGDPRGEFVRLQLALEDPDLPADRREPMRRAAEKLLERHEAEWLGLPAESFVSGRFDDVESDDSNREFWTMARGVQYIWQRGWVSGLRISDLSRPVSNDLTTTPILRLVQSVAIDSFAVPPSQGELADVLKEFLRWPLRHVAVHLGSGDWVADAVIASGVIDRVLSLDLSSNQLSDDAAIALASYPGTARLKSLDLFGNYLTALGRHALAEVGHKDLGRQLWDAGRGDAYV